VTTDAERFRTALDTLGWSGRYAAWRCCSDDRRFRRFASGAEQVPLELLAWIEGAARFFEAHPLPEGWLNGERAARRGPGPRPDACGAPRGFGPQVY
jgi:hypothetical protein